MATRGIGWILAAVGGLLGGGTASPQEAAERPERPNQTTLVRTWQEGVPIRVRVPLATDTHEVMSAVTFPEGGIQAAITGWSPNALTAIQKGSILFLRLARKSEGQLNVIGDSGTHYLLYLEAVAPEDRGAYDAYLKIVRPDHPSPKPREAGPERGKLRGPLELIRAMRMGESRQGTRILRARGEVLYSSQELQLRLLFVYEEPGAWGRIYEVRNLSDRKFALDASRFRAAEGTLLLSALRENLIPPGGVSRLYTVYWRP
ncbi:MAG: hypothetical protein JO332_20380 [Planctomycetaceae bacterium]|nr:hypothetical protein [Planctomycetaceae bacterium]